MATPTDETPKKDKKGLKKLWKKITAVVRSKSRSSKSTTIPSTTATAVLPPAAATPSQAAPAPASTAKPKDEIIEPPIIEVDENVEEYPISIEPQPVKATTTASRTGELSEPEMRFNKAQAVFAKYNLELSEADWDHRPKVPYERVAKTIRMRVRYTCHNCSTTFGHDRVCVGCQHRRCKQCIRYPPKRTKPKSQPERDPAAPSSRPPRSDPLCHECQTRLDLTVEECPNCHHRICQQCSQEASVTVEHGPGDPSAPQNPNLSTAAAVS